MKGLKQSINEAIVKISDKTSPNDLVVQINLNDLDEDTLYALFNDSSVNWSKLNDKDLMKLYNLIGSDLNFEEWKEENGF